MYNIVCRRYSIRRHLLLVDWKIHTHTLEKYKYSNTIFDVICGLDMYGNIYMNIFFLLLHIKFVMAMVGNADSANNADNGWQ